MGEKTKDKKYRLWGVATSGEAFITNVSGTYLSYFLTDVALLPLGFASTILMGTSIYSFIIGSITGGILASIKPMKWGRLRSWLLIGPPVAVVFLTLHMTFIPNNAVLSTLIIILGYVIGSTAWNFAYTSNISLTNIIARSQQERTKYNSQRLMGTNIGFLLGGYLTPIIVAALTPSIGVKAAYPVMTLIAGVYYLIVEFAQFKMAEGAELSYYEEVIGDVEEGEKSLTFKDIWDTLKTNGQLIIAFVIDLASNIAGFTLPALAIYYYNYVFEMPNLIATHMLVTTLAGFAGTTCVRLFGTKAQNYRQILLVTYPILTILMMSSKLVSGSPIGFMCTNVLVHAATGLTQPFEMNLYQDNVIYSEWKTGVNANSLIMGLSEIPVKLAVILKNAIIAVVLATSGFVAGVVTPQFKTAMINAYAFVPAFIPMVGFFLLMFAYKLTPEKMAQYKEEIKRRNEAVDEK